MAQLKDIVQLQTVSGDPVAVGDVTLTPQSQALSIRWPKGGFVWNRPLAVLVERDGETERIPVVDVTRTAQVALLGASLAFFLTTLIISIRRRRV
jgi:hypothetical protein